MELLKIIFSVNQLIFQKLLKIIFFKIISRAVYQTFYKFENVSEYQRVIESIVRCFTPLVFIIILSTSRLKRLQKKTKIQKIKCQTLKNLKTTFGKSVNIKKQSSGNH